MTRIAGLTLHIYIYIVIPRCYRASFTAESMKKSHLEDSSLSSKAVKTCQMAGTNPTLTGAFSHWEIEIYQWQNCVRVFTFHPKIHTKYEIQDDSGIATRASHMHCLEKIFPEIIANLHVPEQQ